MLGLSLLIMVVVFRSLLVPLVATGGFALSLFAALGGTVAIFQWGWFSSVFGVSDPGPILNFLPTMLAGILFGLAMDYTLFLASGMREAYAHGAPARTAVVLGFRAGRAVVTAAAIIMISVFGGFIFSESAMIRPIGFALAFGVLVDAFVVRMVILPGVIHLMGDRPGGCPGGWTGWSRTWTWRARPSSASIRMSRESRSRARWASRPWSALEARPLRIWTRRPPDRTRVSSDPWLPCQGSLDVRRPQVSRRPAG